MEEAYYLLENRNGFEEPLKAGTKRELAVLKIALENKEFLSNHTDKEKQAWEQATYYVVLKKEWDIEHCPLIPVDLS
jgi:hypothetical protein